MTGRPTPGWTVYTSWRALAGDLRGTETSQTYADWPTARHHALHLACCRGTLLISLQGPGNIVAAEYDRVTNYWRDYLWPFGVCGNEHEPDGEVCGAQLYWRLGDAQVQCRVCRCWHGALSRPEWYEWQVPR